MLKANLESRTAVVIVTMQDSFKYKPKDEVQPVHTHKKGTTSYFSTLPEGRGDEKKNRKSEEDKEGKSRHAKYN